MWVRNFNALKMRVTFSRCYNLIIKFNLVDRNLMVINFTQLGGLNVFRIRTEFYTFTENKIFKNAIGIYNIL